MDFHVNSEEIIIKEEVRETSLEEKSPKTKYIYLYCQYCIYATTSVETLKTHQFRKHSNYERVHFFKCFHNKCTFTTNKLQLIQTHLKWHISEKYKQFDCDVVEAKVFQCSKCPYETLNEKFITQHKNFCRNREERHYYHCFHCGWKGSAKSLLKRHMRNKHLPKNMRKEYKCASLKSHERLQHISKTVCDFQCESQTENKYQFDRHMKLEHNIENVSFYNCSFCSFKTIYTRKLRQHILCKHSSEKDIEWFQCTQCEYKSNFNYTLSRHIRLKHNTGSQPLHNCSLCSYTTNYKRYLKTHIEYHHFNAKLLECTKCDFKTKYKGSLKAHLKMVHHSEDVPLYSCSQCSFKTLYKKSLTIHNILHMSDNDVVWYHCTECSFKTKYKHVVTTHMKKHQSDCKTISCSFCLFKTIYQNSLTKHMKTHQSDCKTISCSLCSFKTKYKNSLTRHMKNHQSDCKIMSCSFCSFKTNKDYSLKEHVLNKHTLDNDITWFKCTKCDCKYKSKTALLQHLRKKHRGVEFNFKCSFCSFTTNCRRYLKEHELVKHSNDNVSGVLCCTVCDYKTCIRFKFSQHMIRHNSNPTLFKCAQCDHVTKIKDYLRSHIKLKHTPGAEIYECKDCPYKTGLKRNLNTHLIRKHSNRKFCCYHCSYTTDKKLYLKSHINNTHILKIDKSEIVKCEQCSYTSRYKHVMKKHKLTHIGCYSFYCSHCNYKTKFKNCLVQHIKNMHKA